MLPYSRTSLLSRSVLCRAAGNAVIARHCAYALAVASALGAARPAQAANDAYSTDATSGLFSTSFTLNTNTPTTGGTSSPVTGDALFFGTETTGTTTVSNNLTGFTFAGLTFNALASSFLISGNDFSLSGPLLNNSQSQQTLNNNIALTAANTFTTSANGGSLVLNGALSGANAITFAGSGFATVTGNNSGYSGTTVLNGASNVVRITNANALGTGALNMGAGLTILELSGGITFGNNVTSLGGRTAPFLRNFSGTNTYTGTVTQTATGGGTDVESAGGVLNFTGTLTSNLNNNPRVLYVTGAGNGNFTSASTINGVSSTTTSSFNQLTKTGNGTWALAGSATAILSGATIVQGGTVSLDNTTGTFGSGGALTFSGNGGTFNFIGNAAGTSKTLGALAFTFGRGLPQITNNGGTTSLTFASLAARGAGAIGNFVTSGGTVGTPGVAGTDQFLFTAAPGIATTVDQGIFFNGASYAFYDATSGVRALAYGTDAGATTTGATTSVTGTNVQITGDVSAQGSTTLNTLNLSGNRNLTLASGATLTVNGLLQTAGTTAGSTISGGAGIQAAAGAEMVIRTDGTNDVLTISTPILANGANALTKTGSGALTLSGNNTYTGNTNLIGGALTLSGANVGAGTTLVGTGTLNVTGAGGLTGSTTTGVLTVSPVVGGLATVNINTTGTLLFGLGGSVGVAVAGSASSSANNTLDQSTAILNLQAGTIATGGTTTQRDLRFGDANGFGTANITGGNMNIGGFLVAGFGSAGAGGIVNLSGGALTVNPIGNFGGTIGTTANAYGVFNVSGGSYSSQNTTASGLSGIFIGESGVGTLNVSGTGALNLGGVATSAGLDLGRNGGAVGIVNLGAIGSGGGNITTNIVRHSSTTATGIFNFHGGTLTAATGIANTGTTAGTGNSFMGGLTGAYVYGEGGTINNNAQAITISQPLIAPTGSGITAIPVTSGGTNYATAPIVVISGGGGIGATAVATVDATGTITGITITNPGTGYTSQPTITLVGGALSGSTPATFGTATRTANVSGGLTFAGSSTTTLTGANTYAGATNITAGTLAFTTSQSTGLGSFSVASGATLGLQGIATGPTVVSTGGLTFGTGTTTLALNLNNTANPSTALATFSGALTKNGTISVTLAGTGGLTTATNIPLLRYASESGTGSFVLATAPAGHTTYTLTDTATALFLNVSAVINTWKGTVNNAWDINTTSNWSAPGQKYLDGDIVVFDDTGNNTTINLAANVSPSSTTFNNSGVDYTINSSGGFAIAGSGALVKSGSSMLTLNTANTYTGGTTINGGTVAVNSATSLGAASGALTLNAGTLEPTANITTTRNIVLGDVNSTISPDAGVTYAVSGAVSGTGTLNMSGSGTLALSGTNTYTGGTVINSGIVSVGTNASLGATASAVTFNGGTLQTTNTALLTDTHVLNVTFGGGTLNVNGTGTNGTSQFFLATANTLIGSGPLTLTGTGTLNTSGAGNLRVGAANTYNGTLTAASGGIFEYGVTGAVDVGAFFQVGDQGEVTVNTGITMPNAINVNGSTNSVLSFENGTTGNYSGNIALNGNLTVGLRDWYNYATVRSGTISGIMSGTGGLTTNTGTSTAAATLTLTGANTYTGTTTINASNVTLVLGVGGELSPNSAIVDNGVFQVNRAAGAVQGTDFGSVISGTGGVTATAGTVVLNGANTFSGSVSASGGGILSASSINSVSGGVASSNLGAPTTVAGGTINLSGLGGSGTLLYTGAGETTDRVINLAGGTAGSTNATLDQSGTGTLTFTSALTATGGLAHVLTLQGSTAGVGVFNGAIVNNSATNTTAVVKAGTGTWRLGGTNTYTGGTTVNGGILTITANSALGAGNATVATTATNLTIGTGVTAPFNGNSFVLTLAGGGTVNIADVGYLNLNSGVNITVAGLVLGTTTEPAGTYTAANFPEYISGSGSVTVTGAVPEPSTWVMMLGGAAGIVGWTMRRKRCA